MNEHQELAIRALQQMREDHLNHAIHGFKNMPPQILARSELHQKRIMQAIEWVENQSDEGEAGGAMLNLTPIHLELSESEAEWALAVLLLSSAMNPSPHLKSIVGKLHKSLSRKEERKEPCQT